jgi:hypothetical protein
MAWHIHTWAPRSKSVYYHFRAALRAKRPQQIKFSLPAHSLNPNPHENCQLKSKLAWHRIKPTHVLVGQDRTGQDRTGQDRTGQDRTGHKLFRKSEYICQKCCVHIRYPPHIDMQKFLGDNDARNRRMRNPGYEAWGQPRTQGLSSWGEKTLVDAGHVVC